MSNPTSEPMSPTGEQEGQAGAQQQRPVQQRIEVDDTRAISAYANFCRVTGTPEELIVDFALNPTTHGRANPAGSGVTANCHQLLHCQANAACATVDDSPPRTSLWRA